MRKEEDFGICRPAISLPPRRLPKKGTGTTTNRGLTCDDLRAVVQPLPYFSKPAGGPRT